MDGKDFERKWKETYKTPNKHGWRLVMLKNGEGVFCNRYEISLEDEIKLYYNDILTGAIVTKNIDFVSAIRRRVIKNGKRRV